MRLGWIPFAFFFLFAASGFAQQVSAPVKANPPASADSIDSAQQASALRLDAAHRAVVWRAPPVPIEQFDFLNGEKGPDAFDPQAELTCKLEVKKISGRTPKFLCILPNGDSLKIKYHIAANPNAEVPAEIVASRLLRALGFGADRMYTVKSVRCMGCPEDPFKVIEALFHEDIGVREKFLRGNGVLQPDGSYAYRPDYSKWTDFHLVNIERKMNGRPILGDGVQGFGLHELQDPGYLGAKPPVDALNLLMAFLYNSDTTFKNQELLCLDPDYSGGYCRQSFVSIHDSGAVLGAGMQSDGKTLNKFDLKGWKQAPVWEDEKLCQLKIKSHRWATFGSPRISEEGRVFLSKLLKRLTRNQVADLFRGAKAYEFSGSPEPEKKVIDRWVKVFFERLKAITMKKGHCPAISGNLDSVFPLSFPLETLTLKTWTV